MESGRNGGGRKSGRREEEEGGKERRMGEREKGCGAGGKKRTTYLYVCSIQLKCLAGVIQGKSIALHF